MSIMKVIVLSPDDNVATTTVDLKKGSSVKVMVGNQIREVKLRQDIQRGHKFALTRLKKGANVVKYGEVIGVTTKIIDEGKHVHIHNVISRRGRGDL